jgi:hypothetical protein
MKYRLVRRLFAIATFAIACSAFAQPSNSTVATDSSTTRSSTQEASIAITPPARESFHIYLLLGQSNMAGRGELPREPIQPDRRILVLDGEDRWIVARDPLHAQVGNIKPGVGPGLSFAQQMVKYDPNITIGLIPCAVGGTALKRWVKGGDLYEKAVARARKVENVGIISGVLWHQGESDSTALSNAETYESRLTKMFQDLRQDLNSPDLPIVVGQLGMFFSKPKEKAPYADVVRNSLKKMPDSLPNIGFADSAGLTDKGDGTHFTADSQRQFGVRYAESMHALKSH